jgi:hypothetical protein
MRYFEATLERARSSPPFHFFLVDNMPEGESPEQIRESWVGLALPVRYPRRIAPDRFAGRTLNTRREVEVDDGIAILYEDCIAALERAGHTGAAAYWEVRGRGVTRYLIFGADHGVLLAADVARRLRPDLVDVT